jgi:hypothetical protein
LTYIYVESARKAQELDNILLSVDVVLLGSSENLAGRLESLRPDAWEAVFVLDPGMMRLSDRYGYIYSVSEALLYQ